ncbi:hypothetical protein SAMN05421594_3862 [Chryseobacterium oleae]|uniref:Uncharacterized protein n=2 Tax=Chryseobacterium TaxID=59732 RepID=A0A1I5B8M6_CHROL|nr:hypothetical protein [Chryseobacterium oleae]SFN71062.1 hypothetical protein SAMN05421594_3862 [Chryseobacterium oleae]
MESLPVTSNLHLPSSFLMIKQPLFFDIFDENKSMSVKVRFYSDNVEFDFENSVEFPIAPQIGDEVNLISFFKYKTSERLEYYNNMDDLDLYNDAVVSQRTWCNDLDKEEVYLLVKLTYRPNR